MQKGLQNLHRRQEVMSSCKFWTKKRMVGSDNTLKHRMKPVNIQNSQWLSSMAYKDMLHWKKLQWRKTTRKLLQSAIDCQGPVAVFHGKPKRHIMTLAYFLANQVVEHCMVAHRRQEPRLHCRWYNVLPRTQLVACTAADAAGGLTRRLADQALLKQHFNVVLCELCGFQNGLTQRI